MLRNKPVTHRKYWLETYGCQMNTAESNALEMTLQASGIVAASCAEEADCVILNTCSVRKTAENRIWGRIGFFQHLKDHHPLTLIITGCMAERLGDAFLKDAPAVDYVMGTNDKQRIAALLCGASIDGHDMEYSFTESYYKEGEVKSFVPIMNGCDNFCSYCIVPYVRGRELSRSPQSIYDEVARLEEHGVREITLLGQNVNSYRYESQGSIIRYPDLLASIAARLRHIRWIRFESPHPKDFPQELIEVIASEDRVAKHLHIPMQSGSSHILSLMNRRYTREQFIGLIQQLRDACPDLTFTTDVMVGFPGESEADFLDTLSAIQQLRFIEAFMYYYNPREGTRATSLPDQIESSIRIKRLQELIAMQREITVEEKSKRCCGVVEVLLESLSKRNELEYLARTEHDEMVVFTPLTGCRVGDIVPVQLTGLSGNTYTAAPIAR
ncbi:MAG: tRNA (N6-isopentenyl adenosine(37)-C2)-methylthiotransferase MiaB [Sphaerochaetaceae bacterium]